jgi:hypothetical protein
MGNHTTKPPRPQTGAGRLVGTRLVAGYSSRPAYFPVACGGAAGRFGTR